MTGEMRALLLTRYGGPEAAALRTVLRPVPGAGELLVRVRAAGLNPVDFKTRVGKLKVIQRYPLPAVMGNELAGVVEASGPGVTRFAVGDRVFARMPKAAMGAFADYAVLPETVLAAIPPALDFETAAGVPLAGLTALQALRDELAVFVTVVGQIFAGLLEHEIHMRPGAPVEFFCKHQVAPSRDRPSSN